MDNNAFYTIHRVYHSDDQTEMLLKVSQSGGEIKEILIKENPDIIVKKMSEISSGSPPILLDYQIRVRVLQNMVFAVDEEKHYTFKADHILEMLVRAVSLQSIRRESISTIVRGSSVPIN